MPGAVLAGQVARLPYEAVCIDMQHGLSGFTDVAAMSPAIVAAGKPVIIRVLWNEPGLSARRSMSAPRRHRADDQHGEAKPQALVKAAKYPPMGMRSWGGYAAVQAAGWCRPTISPKPIGGRWSSR